MDAKTYKLGQKLKDHKLAAALVAAGIDNPAKLRKATDAQLEKLPGVGTAGRDKIRERVKPAHGRDR